MLFICRTSEIEVDLQGDKVILWWLEAGGWVISIGGQGRIQSKISEGVQNFQGRCTFSTHKVVILQ